MDRELGEQRKQAWRDPEGYLEGITWQAGSSKIQKKLLPT
jgi:hypothetical protein